LSRHESAHVGAASLLGLAVSGLTITPSGGMMTGARASESPDDLCKQLMATLAPAVELGIVPTWPPNPYAAQDERDAYALAAALGLDAAGYKQVAVETRRLVELPRYRRLRAAIERAAFEHGSLEQAAIERIVEASAARPRPERRAMAERLDALEREIAALDRALERRLARKTFLAVDTKELISDRETWLDLDELEGEIVAEERHERNAEQDAKAGLLAEEFKDLQPEPKPPPAPMDELDAEIEALLRREAPGGDG
jgi:hypothetical protein